MRGLHCLLRFILCCVCGCAPLIAASAEAELATRVDRLFAAWDRSDTPGAVLAVLRDGKPVLSRGYGMANLETTCRTRRRRSSTSRRSPSSSPRCAIMLLARDGKLSLDDEIRKHVPELPAGSPITIRHLLHHTSGLRDQWDLLMLAGLRLDDVITESDILGLLWQQRALNFTPGDEELYSNSGYTLLALIVKRVSGQSLDAFAQQRIFKPLDLAHRIADLYLEAMDGIPSLEVARAAAAEVEGRRERSLPTSAISRYAHVRPLHHLADRHGVCSVVLALLAAHAAERDELGCHQTHGVAVGSEEASPVGRTRVGLHADHARRERRDQCILPAGPQCGTDHIGRARTAD